MNIPSGYDENGVRAGHGAWQDACPECGSEEVYRNGCDELICDNCGYEEGDDNQEESEVFGEEGKEITGRYLDEETGEWSDWKTVTV